MDTCLQIHVNLFKHFAPYTVPLCLGAIKPPHQNWASTNLSTDNFSPPFGKSNSKRLSSAESEKVISREALGECDPLCGQREPDQFPSSAPLRWLQYEAALALPTKTFWVTLKKKPKKQHHQSLCVGEASNKGY